MNNHYQVLSQSLTQQIDLLGKQFETDTGLGKWQFSLVSRAGLALKRESCRPCRGAHQCHLPHLADRETETGDRRDFIRIRSLASQPAFQGVNTGQVWRAKDPARAHCDFCRASTVLSPTEHTCQGRLHAEVTLLNCSGAVSSAFSGR